MSKDQGEVIPAEKGWLAVYEASEEFGYVHTLEIVFWIRTGPREMVPLVLEDEGQRLIEAKEYSSDFTGPFMGLLAPGESADRYYDKSKSDAEAEDQEDRRQDAKLAQEYLRERGATVTETEARALLDFLATSSLKQAEIPNHILGKWLEAFRWRYPNT